MTKFHLIVLTLLVWTTSSFAQVVIDKENPAITDVVTITYDAKQGNGQLVGNTGDVFIYSTGVITDQSVYDNDILHSKDLDLNNFDPKLKMTALGNDLYSLTFTIADLYGVLATEKVIKLKFVFCNPITYKVGTTSDYNYISVVLDKTYTYVGENYISHQFSNNVLKVVGDKGTLEFTYFKTDVVKTEFHPNGVTIKDTTFTVVQAPEVVSLNLVDNPTNLNLSSSDLQVVIKKNPLQIYFVKGTDTTLCDFNGYIAKSSGGGGGSFQVKSDEAYYGSGSRATPINRRGQNLWGENVANYGYENNTPYLNICIPFVISNKGYGLFFDNNYPIQLDLGATDSKTFYFTTKGGALRYYYIGGDNYETILDSYTQLTGKQSMPPMWSLGYIQSKYGYQTETEARKIVTDLRVAKFPVEGLVLDLYWFGQKGDMGNLSWNYTNWPNPTKMMSDFKDLNIKTILITEPYFTTTSTNYSTLAANNLLSITSGGAPYVVKDFWAGEAGLIDITKKDATDWMWNSYRDRHNEGVAGWWCDLGEPEKHPSDMQHSLGSADAVHNIYSLLWAKMLSENYTNEFGDERLFNLIRSGFAGMQRYSTFPWSGDVNRSWSGLNAQVPIMLGAGMSGIGYMHSDAGGFTNNGNNGELFARWIQLATFSPILRIHGVGNVEPIYYAEPYKSIARNYINLRYKLLPYNYTLAYENTTKGLPLARQSDFYEPNNTALKNINDQYLWGENLLVAPIMATKRTSRTVKFPSGTWIDFFTNKSYTGSASIPCDINNLLLFAKAGAFIPMAANSVKNTTSYNTDSLDVAYFPAPSVPTSNYTLYIDNGTSATAMATNNFELIQFDGNVSASQIVVNVSKSASTFATAPTSRDMQFRIKRVGAKPSSVDINGSNTFNASSLTEFAQQTPAWYYDATAKEVIAHFTWNGQNTALTLSDAIVTSQSTLLANATDFYLNAPTPNPVRDEATIDYYLSAQGNYTLSIYNAMGTLINLVYLNDAPVGAGTYNWQASALPAGLYFIKLSDSSKTVSVKVIKE